MSVKNNTGSHKSTTGYATCSHDPKALFEYNDILFYGATQRRVDASFLQDHDLIINCGAYDAVCGASYSNGPFKKLPKWLDAARYKLTLPPVDEVWLDWADFNVPNINDNFWPELVQNAKDNGVKRIIACCTGGHGRTGTALAALLVSMGWSVKKAVTFLRQSYCHEAVENMKQVEYLTGLSKRLNPPAQQTISK